MKVVYVAHPLSAPTAEAREANRRRAGYLASRIAVEFNVATQCSWVALAEHLSETEGRELGLKIDCAHITRSDELWLCGPKRPLSPGMAIEHAHAIKMGVAIVDKRGIYE